MCFFKMLLSLILLTLLNFNSIVLCHLVFLLFNFFHILCRFKISNTVKCQQLWLSWNVLNIRLQHFNSHTRTYVHTQISLHVYTAITFVYARAQLHCSTYAVTYACIHASFSYGLLFYSLINQDFISMSLVRRYEY